MMGRMSVFALLLSSASGCSSLLQHDAPSAQVYVLRPAAPANARVAAAGTPALRVARTQTAPGLDTDRIVLIRSDHRMDYFAASRWPAPLPEVVEALAVETLRNSGVWSAVHDSRGAFPADYFLQIDIRRFEADYTEGNLPKVHVSLGCTLGRRVEQEAVKSFVAEGSATAATNRLGAVIEAFETATRSAMAVLAEYDAAAQKVESPVPSMNR